MEHYYRLLIQQWSPDNTDGGPIVDTLETFHVACQEFPYKYLPETKEPAKRDWYDEDGEDVYIPTGGLKFKAYDLEVKFLYVGNEPAMSDDLRAFIDFLYGRNSNGYPSLHIYDEYTKTGRRQVYATHVDNEEFAYDDANPEVIAVFKVRFRVSDPTTNILLAKNDDSK